MGRPAAGVVAPPPAEIELFLLVGPLNHGPREFTDEQGEAAWSAYGPKLMAEWRGGALPGSRPFGFWRYEIGTEPDNYDDRVVLLAERGDLSEEEVEDLARRRRWRDINTGVEHTDPAAVELYERVVEALKRTEAA